MQVRTLAWAFLIAIPLACGGGGDGEQGGETATVSIPALPDGISATPLVLIAGMQQLEPSANPAPANLDLDRLGLTEPPTVYELAAPAGSTFEFDVISQGLELAGEVSVSIAHVQDDGATPEGGLETIARAGVLLSGSGGVATNPWQIYRGDGFARATFHGRIDREQIYAVSAVSELGETTALICVRNSTGSKIALPPTTIGTYPNVVETRTLYSSPSLNFGLPVASISGDRTTIVSYEGDRDTGTGGRYELRLQYDHTTGAVTGGAQEETNPDSGNWRDHDVASLFNVLALAHSGGDGVSLKLSYDRGATFAQVEQVAPAAILGRTRLVSVAMAADYSLAISFWRPGVAGGSELVVVVGRPDSVDTTGSPTHFAFDPARIVHFDKARVTPLITGLAWSDGGDLVVGYGFTRFVIERRRVITRSQTIFRCAVLPWNGDDFLDTLVDWEEQVFSRDPSVTAVGAYPDLSIHYAYEGRDGVRLASSADGGQSFSKSKRIGPSFAYMPTVVARGKRLDLFHLATTSRGTELFLHQWDDFETGVFESYRLTTATSKPVREFESLTMPGANWGIRNATLLILETDITQVGRFGYDVTRAGDELHVVIHEDHDLRYIWLETLGLGPNERIQFMGGNGAREPFEPVQPPPLAEGLTGPLPAPQAEHRHQLRLLRLQ